MTANSLQVVILGVSTVTTRRLARLHGTRRLSTALSVQVGIKKKVSVAALSQPAFVDTFQSESGLSGVQVTVTQVQGETTGMPDALAPQRPHTAHTQLTHGLTPVPLVRSDTDGGKGLTTGIIVLIAIAATIGVVVIGGVIFYLATRGRGRGRDRSGTSTPATEMAPVRKRGGASNGDVPDVVDVVNPMNSLQARASVAGRTPAAAARASVARRQSGGAPTKSPRASVTRPKSGASA